MSTLNLSGRVVHGVLTEGCFPPAVGATVQVLDVGDDLIWSGQTDSNGAFGGQRLQGTVPGHYEGSSPDVRWVPASTDGYDLRVPDPLLLRAVVSQNTPAGPKSQAFRFPQSVPQVATAPLILPWAAPVVPIGKSDRALVVVTHLVGAGAGNWQALYQFLNVASVMLADGLLGSAYRVVTKLVGAQATKQAFLTALQTCGNDPTIREIDVILNLHGGDETLFFSGGGVSMAALRTDLVHLNLSSKLRLLYSTACFGESHADDFVAAGFDAVVGATAINASSAAE